MYQIIKKGKEVLKEYSDSLRCTIWCLQNGYIYSGRGKLFLDPDIRIKKKDWTIDQGGSLNNE